MLHSCRSELGSSDALDNVFAETSIGKAKARNLGIITVHSFKSHKSKPGHLLTWKIVFTIYIQKAGLVAVKM